MCSLLVSTSSIISAFTVSPYVLPGYLRPTLTISLFHVHERQIKFIRYSIYGRSVSRVCAHGSSVRHNSAASAFFSVQSVRCFPCMHPRFYPGWSAENREDLRSMKEREARIAVGKAAAGGPIKKVKTADREARHLLGLSSFLSSRLIRRSPLIYLTGKLIENLRP